MRLHEGANMIAAFEKIFDFIFNFFSRNALKLLADWLKNYHRMVGGRDQTHILPTKW